MDMFFELVGFILSAGEYLGIVHLIGGLVLAFGLAQDYSFSESRKYLLGGGLILIVGGLAFGHLLDVSLRDTVRLHGSAGQAVGLGMGFFVGTMLGLCFRSLSMKFRKGEE